ncbi:hypothetical protein BC832DRAFT_601540 [Gaertneriomyces semiglobifer]|nr:hypothetical protein BC832DRAFT_601540 [Gaertneriomyces semiglobifer]
MANPRSASALSNPTTSLHSLQKSLGPVGTTPFDIMPRPSSQQQQQQQQQQNQQSDEKQLQNALSLIHSLFSKRTHQLSSETNKYRALADQHASHIASLQSNIHSLHQRVQDLEHILVAKDKDIHDLKSVNQGLTKDRLVLTDRYRKMVGRVRGLEAFRKSIVGLVVENGDVGATGTGTGTGVATTTTTSTTSNIGNVVEEEDVVKTRDEPDTQNMDDENLHTFLPFEDSFINDVTMQTFDLTAHSLDLDQLGQQQQQQQPRYLHNLRQPKGINTNANTSTSVSGDRTDSISRSSNTPTPKPTFPSTTTNTTSTTTNTTSTSTQQQQQQPPHTISAPLLYKQIRSTLTPPQFEDFANTIAAFNAGYASAEETVRKMEVVIGDKELCERMRVLVWTAVEEGGRKDERGDGENGVDG